MEAGALPESRAQARAQPRSYTDAVGPTAYDPHAGAVGDNSSMSVYPPRLTFTPANWHLPQTVVARAVDDDVAQGDRVVRIVHAASSADLKYNDLNMATLYATVREDDYADVVARCPASQPGTSGGGSGCVAEARGGDGPAPGAALFPSSAGSMRGEREAVSVRVTEGERVQVLIRLASRPYDAVNVSFAAADM